MDATDPLFQGILSGVIANALTAFTGSLCHALGGARRNPQPTQQLHDLESQLDNVLEGATSALARFASKSGWSAEELRIFLASPDVDAVARQLYAIGLDPDRGSELMERLHGSFIARLSLGLGRPQKDILDVGEEIFRALQVGCKHALQVAIAGGILSAHEAMSAQRTHMLLDELASIQRTLDLLSAQKSPNIQATLEFEDRYRTQVANRHAHITPPHFDAIRKIPIDDLYVTPHFSMQSLRKEEPGAGIVLSEFLAMLYRAVLLGNPGGGKSTLALKVCHDLATRRNERLLAGRQVIPILVLLRDYGAEKKTHSCSIVQFIETTASSKYQLNPPDGAFEYLLVTGRAMVIFDGLDELLDTSYRQEISGDVESFCGLYPTVPVLVTSREVGYEQAPLDGSQFDCFRLADLSEGQVQEYSGKWFSLDSDLSAVEQNQKATAFVRESEIVADLRANPLMLALMCNIYRGESYIPRNRPEVYEKCATMLFERWDKSRGILVTLPFEAHISPAIKHLAYWIYSDESLQGGVTETRLVAQATDYLTKWRFENRNEAEYAAREFIEFCRGRAWVFTDTGTTREGERLYQFTHRTFLEYFAAAHLVRTHSTPDTLADILLPHLQKREWDIVAQLAIQLQHKNYEGAGDDILSRLVEQATKSDSTTAWNLLSFASRSLGFLVPRPAVARQIAIACVQYCLKWVPQTRSKDILMGDPHQAVFEAAWPLLDAASENRTVIANTLEKTLIDAAGSAQGLELVHVFELASICARIGGRHASLDQIWQGMVDRLFEAREPQARSASQRSFSVAYNAFWMRKIRLSEIIQWHGAGALFRPAHLSLLNGRLEDIADGLLHRLARHTAGKRWGTPPDSVPSILGEVGEMLLSIPPPWIKHKAEAAGPNQFWRWHRFVDEDNATIPIPRLDSTQLFGAFLLFAAVLEACSDKNPALQVIQKNSVGSLQRLQRLLLAWDATQGVDPKEVEQSISECGFNDAQANFARDWIASRISLVAKRLKGRRTDVLESL